MPWLLYICKFFSDILCSDMSFICDCYPAWVSNKHCSLSRFSFTVLTENQFRVLASMDSCRKLWVHGLPGSGKTVLAVMMIKHLVKRRESPVLFVAENQGIVSKLA